MDTTTRRVVVDCVRTQNAALKAAGISDRWTVDADGTASIYLAASCGATGVDSVTSLELITARRIAGELAAKATGKGE